MRHRGRGGGRSERGVGEDVHDGGAGGRLLRRAVAETPDVAGDAAIGVAAADSVEGDRGFAGGDRGDGVEDVVVGNKIYYYSLTRLTPLLTTI